ncbi:hypothetical protein WR25_21210 [Diploscapter pachys]|uniref:Uncharacterized protein n=1 Tax=Diploscapter pachys TaxID=2018661 RepID=A0A2A2KY02_9BILA|nr:hypothetical protein WR25_21210 [Diploscapter pachys]
MKRDRRGNDICCRSNWVECERSPVGDEIGKQDAVAEKYCCKVAEGENQLKESALIRRIESVKAGQAKRQVTSEERGQGHSIGVKRVATRMEVGAVEETQNGQGRQDARTAHSSIDVIANSAIRSSTKYGQRTG